MKALIKFEFSAFTKKAWFYLLLLFFAFLGFMVATSANQVSLPNVYKNAPYSNTYFMGLFSLICIFIATLLAAKVLFKEKDSHFDLILYTTPIAVKHYLASRFLVVFGVTVLCFFCIVLGYMLGQQMPYLDRTLYAPLSISHYLHPFLVMVLPNILFCSAVVCSVGFLSKNKLLVYVSGLFLYIFYLVVMLFSGSPLLVGSFPQSEAAMRLSAQFDPFGMSAFFHQTTDWLAPQRNTEGVALTGYFLFNRLFFIGFSMVLLGTTAFFFKFKTYQKTRKTKGFSEENDIETAFPYKTITPQLFNLKHRMAALLSFVKIDLTFILKSIPFLLIAIGFAFYQSMEIYGEIDKGIRLPENYASTALMVNRIIKDFPVLCLFTVLFYSSEIVWHSPQQRFNLIENTTPISRRLTVFSKWLSLNNLVLILLIWIIGLALFFQILYQYTVIEWRVYGMLFYLIGLPLMLSVGVLVAIQSLVKNKYLGLILGLIFILLTTTSLGRQAGFSHPLMRFNASFAGRFSDMNGWGMYLEAFHWKMLFGVGTTLILFFTPLSPEGFGMFHILIKKQVKSSVFPLKNKSKWQFLTFLSLIMITLFSGFFIFKQVKLSDKQAENDWQQGYEQQYRRYQNLPKPTITSVKTAVDLYPEKNSYKVSASYVLQNKTAHVLDSILLYFDKDLGEQKVNFDKGILLKHDTEFGHYWFKFHQPLQANDSFKLDFQFTYNWSPFNGHESFNAIIENGSFMRLSNYFPRFGYQSFIEISDEKERGKRGLGTVSPILKLEDPLSIEDDFVQLDMTISTSKNQIAIGVGDLSKTWEEGDRRYFQYTTPAPIPFRFGIASADYAVEKREHKGTQIEVFYHPKHAENVQNLIQNAQNTLYYCETHFGKYPYKTIRFAEISAFTNGFAATAYPATIFMTENMIFHANIKGDKQQDVINELAGHELSHEWWGANQLTTDNREGAKFLTETLAMYTELMLVKKMYGQPRVLENVQMHHNIYLSQRGFSDEQPLYKTMPDNVHLHYSKGLVTMYQLSELLGENKVNTALKSFFDKHAYPKQTPISTDLIQAFYAVSDTVFHSKIDDLFRRIITYKMAFKNAQITKSKNDYTIDFQLDIEKYEENGQGKQTAIPFNDCLEIAFQFGNGKTETRIFKVENKAFKTSVSMPQKVVKMTIDPSFKFIKLNKNTVFEL